MTATPLPPFPRPSVFDPGRFGVAYSQTQMAEFATQARADLEAEVQRLREALKRIESMCAAPPDFSDATIQDVARAALKDTKWN